MNNKHNLKNSNLTGGNIDDIAKYHKSYANCEKLKDNRYKKACHNASKNGQSYISSPSFGGYEILNQKNKAITNKLIQKYNESKLAFMKSNSKMNTKTGNTKTKKNKSKHNNSRTKRNKTKRNKTK